MYSIGEMVGGAMAVVLIGLIIERFFFKNDEPASRAGKTMAVTLAIAWVLSGLGNADGAGFDWFAGINYVPGAIAVFFWFKSRYTSNWTDEFISEDETGNS